MLDRGAQFDDCAGEVGAEDGRVAEGIARDGGVGVLNLEFERVDCYVGCLGDDLVRSVEEDEGDVLTGFCEGEPP